MKRQILIKALTIICGFVLTCCSSEDNTSIPKVESDGSEFATALPGVKVKKITETSNPQLNGETTTITFNYNSNDVLLNIVATHYKIFFYYENNKIVKAVIKRFYKADETLYFFYEGDFLIKTVDMNVIDTYTYENGILHTREQGYGTAQNFNIASKTDFFFEGGNIAQTLNTYGQLINKYVYTYDNKNSPFKNMVPILKYMLGAQSFNAISENNRLTQNYYSPMDSNTPEILNYEITYDANDYPIHIAKLDDGYILSEATIEYQ